MGIKGTLLAILMLIGVASVIFFVIIVESNRVYVSTGTVSSMTYSDNHWGNDVTRVRFMGTDFSIAVYGNCDYLKIGHQYTFTYKMDQNEIAVIENIAEVK